MAEDSLTVGLKGLIRKYLELFPFVRQDAFAEIVLNPSSAIPTEIRTSSIGKGFRDAIVPAYISSIAALIVGFFIGLVIPATTGISSAEFISVYGLSSLITLLLLPLAVIIGMGFNAVVYFAAARILDGKEGNFRKTMGMLGTLSAPIYALNIIPNMLDRIPIVACAGAVPALVISLYGLYLNFRMVKEMYGLEGWKAIAVVLAPIALVAVLLIALVIILIASGAGAALLTYMNAAGTSMPSTG
jgi:hypothetical protein